MLVKFNYLSEALMMQTNVTMFLPSWTAFDEAKGKAKSYLPGTKFQTLYLLHGGTGDDSDYVNFSNIVRYAEEHKMAVVMPSGYNSGYVNDHEDVLPWPRRYWTFVFEELPRVCEGMFPISDKREDRFVAGLSMGAIGAFRCMVYGPERYNTAIMMSGGGMDIDKIMQSVSQFNNGDTDFNIDLEKLAEQGISLDNSENELYKIAKQNADEGKKLPKVIMTCGGNDFIRPFVYACRNKLEEYGYDVMYEEVPGYAHEWDFWDLSLRKALDEWLPIRHDVILK